MKTGDLYGGIDMTKVMFGQNAVHTPGWLILQDAGDNVIVVGIMPKAALAHLMPKTHTLIIGDFVIRPHIASATDACRGNGIGGFIMHPHVEEFIDGDFLVGSLNALIERARGA